MAPFPYFALVASPLVLWALVLTLTSAERWGVKLDGRGVHGLLIWSVFIVGGFGSMLAMRGFDRAVKFRRIAGAKLSMWQWLAITFGALHFVTIFVGIALSAARP